MTVRRTKHLLFPLALTAFLVGCDGAPTPEAPEPLMSDAAVDEVGPREVSHLEIENRPSLYHADVSSVDDLQILMAAARVEDGHLVVPNIAPVSLPEDLDRLPIDARKGCFFRTLLPLVVHENTRVAAQRNRLLEILDPARTIPLTLDEERLVSRLAREYGVHLTDGLDVGVVRAALLDRVDVIPAPLALAQAAIESGWGLSRFAQDGNALFGQWTFDPTRPGLVPEGRPEGADYRIEAFPSIHASIRGYMRNLNTHRAYREFRTLRFAQRQSARPLDALALAGTLHRYSTQEDYVKELRAIMRQNGLKKFMHARLAPAGLDLVSRFAVKTVDDGKPIALLLR